MNVPLVRIPVTSILYARIPWVHTHARVMLGTQEMENLAMVFKIQSYLPVRLQRRIQGEGWLGCNSPLPFGKFSNLSDYPGVSLTKK